MSTAKDNNDIPEMKTQPSQNSQPPMDPKEIEKARKEMEKMKEKLENLKEFILKKYNFTIALGILPAQSIPKFIDDEGVDKAFEKQLPEIEKKYVHLYMVVPEEKFKEIKEIKETLVAEIKKRDEKIWMHVKTPVDVLEYGLDSKFDLLGAVALSYPLHDKGFLSGLRVAEIHKSLILRKFEKYVTSYVIAGSFVRGTATKTSDVDVYVIIDDTDVKRMPRLELKEKLRSIIYQYVMEASELAGVKNKLSPQIYLLTDFWESVKDAHPVIFTFIRDGVPMHDRGAFLPWKALLKMGKIKPSPEAIEMFMSMGDKVIERAKKSLLDIATMDLYYAAITPSQALLMLYGLPPPTPKQVVSEMQKYFVEKEKILEKKYVDILEKIVGIFKDFEHEKIKEIKGVEIDKLIEDIGSYIKRLKELRKQIEKRSQEKTLEHLAQDITQLLHSLFGAKSETTLVQAFEKELVKKGKMPQNTIKIVKEVFAGKEKFKKGELETHKLEELRKNAVMVINQLIEYQQRQEMTEMGKGKMTLVYHEKGKEKFADMLILNAGTFVVKDNVLYKITSKWETATQQELERAIQQQDQKKPKQAKSKLFAILEKELGDFDVIL